MLKIWLKSVSFVLLVSGCFAVPQGRFRARQQQQEVLNQQPSHNLDPTAAEDGMNDEHAKLIENLQRLKRTLDDVKARVGKGTYGESSPVDMKNPEGAILTVLKSLQEQGQLFAMINDMLKAGSEVESQAAKIQNHAKVEQQSRAESSLAEHTNQITPAVPTVKSVPSSPVPSAPAPSASGQQRNASKQQGYDDYQYHYRDDSPDASHYDYHYDAQGYDEPLRSTTTTTTRKPAPQRRLRGRITRSEYY